MIGAFQKCRNNNQGIQLKSLATKRPLEKSDSLPCPYEYLTASRCFILPTKTDLSFCLDHFFHAVGIRLTVSCHSNTLNVSHYFFALIYKDFLFHSIVLSNKSTRDKCLSIKSRRIQSHPGPYPVPRAWTLRHIMGIMSQADAEPPGWQRYPALPPNPVINSFICPLL